MQTLPSFVLFFLLFPISFGAQFVMEDPDFVASRRKTAADQLRLELYEQCPMLSSFYLPIELDNWNESSVTVSVDVVLTRFIAIDDLTKALTMASNINTYWTIPCKVNTSNITIGQYFKKQIGYHYIDRNTGEGWAPALTIRNRATETNIFQ